MTAFGISLLDANVWLALTVETHQHHGLVRKWFDTQSERSCAFCRITQMALLRHLTNAHIMKSSVCNQMEAWRTYQRTMEDCRVTFLSESGEIERYWREWTQKISPSHREWTDGYLAAFAVAANVRLVTLDQDFRKYLPTFSMTTEEVGFDLFVIS